MNDSLCERAVSGLFLVGVFSAYIIWSLLPSSFFAVRLIGLGLYSLSVLDPCLLFSCVFGLPVGYVLYPTVFDDF